jgi:hypothetical protein
MQSEFMDAARTFSRQKLFSVQVVQIEGMRKIDWIFCVFVLALTSFHLYFFSYRAGLGEKALLRPSVNSMDGLPVIQKVAQKETQAATKPEPAKAQFVIVTQAKIQEVNPGDSKWGPDISISEFEQLSKGQVSEDEKFRLFMRVPRNRWAWCKENKNIDCAGMKNTCYDAC